MLLFIDACSHSQLTMAPALMGEKPVSLHHTPPPSQDELPAAQISQNALLHTPGQQREGSGLFDPYGSFMDTIYTSFLQVSERDSDSTSLSYPELPPSLSPRRACSVHNPDLTRLGMDSAQSPARGTPKLSEEPSTAPPCRPSGADALSDVMEEAKTDGSKVCYSNGIGSGTDGRGDRDEEEEEADEDDDDGRRTQGCLSPAVDDISSREAEQVRVSLVLLFIYYYSGYSYFLFLFLFKFWFVVLCAFYNFLIGFLKLFRFYLISVKVIFLIKRICF